MCVAAALVMTAPREAAAQAHPRYGVVQDLAWDPSNEHDQIIAKMKLAGVQIVRMDFRWYMLEPANDQFAFALHDQIVAKLRAQGIHVLGLLSHPPPWANGSSDGTVPPIQNADWQNFVATVAQHFAGQVDAWEIWNEPNLTIFFKPAPSAARYVQMLQLAFNAIRAADPAAKVVLGGLGGNGVFMGWEPVESRYFLQGVYDNGGKGFFDAVAIHPYVHPITVGRDGLRASIQATRNVLTANGDAAVPIWLSEIGWSTAPNAWNQPTITETDAANWVQSVFSCQDSLGVAKVFWHNFRDTGSDPFNVEHNFGLVRGDLTSKPSYDKYAWRTANLIQNDDFASAADCWQQYATPDPSYVSWAVTGEALEFHRAAAPSGSNQATIFQQTGRALPAGTALSAQFDLGNSSTVRKRISILILDADFGDLSVCTMWLAPGAPLRTYRMRTHTTRAWSDASIYFYAATAGADGGAYRLDNVSMMVDPASSIVRTDCIDPTVASPLPGSSSSNLIVDGGFANGLASWWTHGDLAVQASNGLVEFKRPAGTDPAGVIFQPTGVPVPRDQILTATFDLGNSSAVRKRVTVLLHDLAFNDLAACTFWIPPGQSPAAYAMRSVATLPWTNATVSFYAASIGTEEWTQLDNVTLRTTPDTPALGTECIEPGASMNLATTPMIAIGAGGPGGSRQPLPPGMRSVVTRQSAVMTNGANVVEFHEPLDLREPDAAAGLSWRGSQAAFALLYACSSDETCVARSFGYVDAGEWQRIDVTALAGSRVRLRLILIRPPWLAFSDVIHIEFVTDPSGRY